MFHSGRIASDGLIPFINTFLRIIHKQIYKKFEAQISATLFGLRDHYNQSPAIRVGKQNTEEITIKRDVRQGCVLSSLHPGH